MDGDWIRLGIEVVIIVGGFVMTVSRITNDLEWVKKDLARIDATAARAHQRIDELKD